MTFQVLAGVIVAIEAILCTCQSSLLDITMMARNTERGFCKDSSKDTNAD